MASLVGQTGGDPLEGEAISSKSKKGQPASDIVLELDTPIFVQSLENKSVNLICANCGVHLPSVDAQVQIFQDYSLVQSVYTDDWCSEYLNNFDANVFDSVIDANEKSSNIKIRYATSARVNSAVETYIVVNNAGTTTARAWFTALVSQ